MSVHYTNVQKSAMDFKLQKKNSSLLCIAATYIFLSFNNFQVLGGLQCESNMAHHQLRKQAEWMMK